jgi:hypothetical protein
MHFAVRIPEWNSLDSVRRAHSWLEAFALVFFALLVMFDVLAHMYEKKSDNLAHRLEKIGLWFFAIAVLSEIAAYPYGQRNDTLSEQTIGSLSQLASQAKENAKTALTDSGTALTQSAQALTKAGDARKKADTFEAGIVSANQKAADAESHLAEALERANSAEKESIRLRDVLGGWQLDEEAKKCFAKDVKSLAGTPFDLAANPVEAPFMEELDALLTSPSVGWIRLPPKPDKSFMAILIDGKASIILSSGIVLEVDQDQVDSLKPALIAIGRALHEELAIKSVALHLVPSGTWGKRIHIIIGKRE